MKPEVVYTKSAPKTGFSEGVESPIAQGVRCGQFLFVSGQGPLDPVTKEVVSPDLAEQTRVTLDNVRAVLEAAGSSMRELVRFQTFLTHAADIDGFMKARKEVFPRYFPDGVYPPNTILVVSRLVLPELLVEIEAMAVKPGATNGRARPGAPGRGARASGRRKTSRRRG